MSAICLPPHSPAWQAWLAVYRATGGYEFAARIEKLGLALIVPTEFPTATTNGGTTP